MKNLIFHMLEYGWWEERNKNGKKNAKTADFIFIFFNIHSFFRVYYVFHFSFVFIFCKKENEQSMWMKWKYIIIINIFIHRWVDGWKYSKIYIFFKYNFSLHYHFRFSSFREKRDHFHVIHFATLPLRPHIFRLDFRFFFPFSASHLSYFIEEKHIYRLLFNGDDNDGGVVMSNEKIIQKWKWKFKVAAFFSEW